MDTQTRLSRHNKFISAENITLLSVSSDIYMFVCVCVCVCNHAIIKFKRDRILLYIKNIS